MKWPGAFHAPMKASTLIAVILVNALVCVLGTAAARQDTARDAIAVQSRALMAAIGNGDAAAAGSLFTDDAKLSVPGTHGVLSGRLAITNFWQSAINGGVKDLALTTADLAGDGEIRVETGTYAARGADRVELGRGQYLFVWQKKGGVWKISRDFAHPDAAAPEVARESDRVGYPHNYAAGFRKLGGTEYDEAHGLTTVYANEPAAAASQSERASYPHGSVILMEFAEPQRDGEDQLLRDARGQLIRGPIAHIDVMRRGAGYGAGYGEDRAGEWEFASYAADGSARVSAEQGVRCAACHRKAGAEKDYVFRSRSWSAAH
jgi:ketosteroid isomerase-like protein